MLNETFGFLQNFGGSHPRTATGEGVDETLTVLRVSRMVSNL